MPCQTFLHRRHFQGDRKVQNGFLHNSATRGLISVSKVVLESPRLSLSDDILHHGNTPRPGAALWKNWQNLQFPKNGPKFHRCAKPWPWHAICWQMCLSYSFFNNLSHEPICFWLSHQGKKFSADKAQNWPRNGPNGTQRLISRPHKVWSQDSNLI